MKLVAGDGFPYGYKKLTKCLREDYIQKINKKKVYRLCEELDIFKPQRKLKNHLPRKLLKDLKLIIPISFEKLIFMESWHVKQIIFFGYKIIL